MRPRKSNFSRPSASQACISNWVMVVRAVGRALQRHDLGQRLAADHDPGGVGGGVAGDALQLLGDPDELVHPLVAGDQLAQLG